MVAAKDPLKVEMMVAISVEMTVHLMAEPTAHQTVAGKDIH